MPKNNLEDILVKGPKFYPNQALTPRLTPRVVILVTTTGRDAARRPDRCPLLSGEP